nr:hypothetical protein [Tanacetum cinerariifolium]
MVAYVSKSDASEGFTQIINFLNGSSIKYALTVNPNIYVSCIKQFWTTVAVKKVNDVIRLQALVEKKKVVVTEATIHEALCLDDAEGVKCLPNEEIFAELARMGYEKTSTKLTFYKAFFSSQWKFLIHTILQCMSAKCTSWNEFSSSMASVVICLSSGRKFNFSKYIFDSLVNAGDAAAGDVSVAHAEVPTVQPPSPLPQQQPQLQQDAGIPMNLLQEVMDTYTALTRRVEHLELDKVAQAMEIKNLKRKVKKLEKRNKGRMIAEMDQDADVVLKDDKEVADDVDEKDESKPAKVQEVVEVVTTAKLITEVVTAASETITAARVVIRDPQKESTTSTIIPAETQSKDKGKRIMVEEPKPLKKQQQIEQDKKYARELEAELNKNIDWDESIDHINMKAKEDNAVKRYQAMKSKPQTEAQARKNMMVYLKNVSRFKMDYFKGMSYDHIHPIFERYFDSNVAFLQKTKEHIEEEESRALKRINETLAERATKRQKVDEELILLVERKYPLTRFTLDQMLNAVRLEVKEESEVSLELLRFTRQQHQEGQLKLIAAKPKLMLLINAAKTD